MNRIRWSIALAAVLTFASAVPGAAQTVGRERARQVLSPEVFARVDAIAAGAEREGLPSAPLWDKALEGAAKRVPSDRIAPALAEYVERLGVARGALGPGPSVEAVVAGADALRRGVPRAALAGVEQGARTPVALVALADLVETGVPVDRALDVVRVALAQRAADEEMLALAARVRAAMRAGQAAAAAADGVGRTLREGGVRRAPTADPARPPVPPAEPTMRPREGR